MTNNYLVHHGIQGQKWGVRRFQNYDGTLTPAGRERYAQGSSSSGSKSSFHSNKNTSSFRVNKNSRHTRDESVESIRGGGGGSVENPELEDEELTEEEKKIIEDMINEHNKKKVALDINYPDEPLMRAAKKFAERAQMRLTSYRHGVYRLLMPKTYDNMPDLKAFGSKFRSIKTNQWNTPAPYYNFNDMYKSIMRKAHATPIPRGLRMENPGWDQLHAYDKKRLPRYQGRHDW